MSACATARAAAAREAHEADGGGASTGPNVPDLSPGGGDGPTGANGQAGNGEGGAPHTGSADPTDVPPSDERGGRTA